MGKKMAAAAALVEAKPYGLKEACELVKRAAYAKFDESVDLALRLGVDPKRADQMIRAPRCCRMGPERNCEWWFLPKARKSRKRVRLAPTTWEPKN